MIGKIVVFCWDAKLPVLLAAKCLFNLRLNVSRRGWELGKCQTKTKKNPPPNKKKFKTKQPKKVNLVKHLFFLSLSENRKHEKTL